MDTTTTRRATRTSIIRTIAFYGIVGWFVEDHGLLVCRECSNQETRRLGIPLDYGQVCRLWVEEGSAEGKFPKCDVCAKEVGHDS